MTDKQTKIYWIVLIVTLVTLITFLHYLTRIDEGLYHVFYRELYFLPIILSGFWFGLRGGLSTSLAITALYVPFVLIPLENFNVHDFGNLMQIVLFNIVGGVLGLLRDRELIHQKELRKAESLATMGKAISSIAHDMKTPLVAIGGFTSQVRRKLFPDEPDCCKKLDMVLQQANRMESMVKDMLAFARPLKLQRSVNDFNKFVQETVEIAQESALKYNVKLQHDSDDRSVPLNFDKHRLQQALLNLISNAIEASPEGEAVTVTVSLTGKRIQVDIADRGEGIRPENREEMFAPFFTTKKEGTGLGLAIVKKIIEAHDGNIEVQDNQGGKGTIFRVALSLV